MWLDAAAYTLLPQCIMGKVTCDCLPEYYGIELERLTDRQTGLKTLPLQTTYAGGNKQGSHFSALTKFQDFPEFYIQFQV